jgi:uncharacterized membrane protein
METSRSRYDFVPRLLQRIFTWGLLWSVLFFVFWYVGGIHLWAWCVGLLIKILTVFQVPLEYSVEQGALMFPIRLAGNPSVEVGYFANQWNLAIAEVILLITLWWDKKQTYKVRFILLCILGLMLYQVFAVTLNISVQALGPNLPNRLGILWEYQNSTFYLVLRKVQLFETFIGRYWAGFPVFGISLLLNNVFLKKSEKKRKKSLTRSR